MVRCCISLLVETKLSSLCQTIIWNGCDMCLFMLHLGATKMLMIQTRWQKNLHISFLTKRSLLDSRYRSSVKKYQHPQHHFCGVMDVTVINLSTCQYYTCLIFHFEFFQQGIHKDQSHRLVCHFFVLTTFWRRLWSITELMHSTIESINFVNQ